MFQRNPNDKRRVVIVDISHLFYKYAFGANSLSATIVVDGVPTVVDTTLPAYTIKQLYRWSNYGFNPLVVCFDGAGSNRSRKAYFIKNSADSGYSEPVGYKGSRQFQNDRFYTGINITYNLLLNGGVVCLKADGYEADDLVKAAVDQAKIEYPDLPIDVVTGDQDLIPLVDDQVSVFISSRKMTWAESKDVEKRNYMQLTPNNMQSYVEDLTDFKKLIVPYNTILLKKLLRGKKADEIPAFPKFTPKKYNELVSSLIEGGYDLGSLFRYDTPTSTICYRGNEEPIPVELIESTPKERKMIKYGEPPALTRICEALSDYVSEDVIQHVRFIYNGINLNGAFTGLPEQFNRRPARLSVPITGFLAPQLQKAVAEVRINLPTN